LEKALCDHVRSRIDNLTESGIEGIWMKSVGDDIYNAGTILGYRGDNWDSILKYSGLCMSDGRCDFRTWPKKLTGFDVETRIFDTSGVSGRVSWFRFFRVIVADSKRSLRSAAENMTPPSVRDSTMTPTDKESTQLLVEFQDNMQYCIDRIAPRFSRDINRLIAAVESLDEVESDEREESSTSPLPDSDDFVKNFNSASPSSQEAAVRSFFLNRPGITSFRLISSNGQGTMLFRLPLARNLSRRTDSSSSSPDVEEDAFVVRSYPHLFRRHQFSQAITTTLLKELLSCVGPLASSISNLCMTLVGIDQAAVRDGIASASGGAGILIPLTSEQTLAAKCRARVTQNQMISLNRSISSAQDPIKSIFATVSAQKKITANLNCLLKFPEPLRLVESIQGRTDFKLVTIPYCYAELVPVVKRHLRELVSGTMSELRGGRKLGADFGEEGMGLGVMIMGDHGQGNMSFIASFYFFEGAGQKNTVRARSGSFLERNHMMFYRKLLCRRRRSTRV
jgi:hypothetical protein